MGWEPSRRPQREHEQPGTRETSPCELQAPSSRAHAPSANVPTQGPRPGSVKHWRTTGPQRSLEGHLTQPLGKDERILDRISPRLFWCLWQQGHLGWSPDGNPKSEFHPSLCIERDLRAFALITSIWGDSWWCILRFESSCSREKTCSNSWAGNLQGSPRLTTASLRFQICKRGIITPP